MRDCAVCGRSGCKALGLCSRCCSAGYRIGTGFLHALAGRQPAEVLATVEREVLVTRLHSQGWPDQRIARHCRMTLYTTARIRERIGLPAHQEGHTQ